MERKLAAILAADVAGYSRLMAAGHTPSAMPSCAVADFSEGLAWGTADGRRS